ncbi:MAG: hypothetical protein LH480_04490 [Rubrivivax sp.]|nr:hypothetical protein [Rubrivivax sp.]
MIVKFSGISGAAWLLVAGLAGPAAWAQPTAISTSTSTPAPSPAASPALPALDSFFGHPDLAQPMLSPSGRWLATLVRGQTPGQRNMLAVIDLQQASPIKVLGQFKDADIGDLHWVGEEHLVFNVVDVQAGGGERRFAPGLFSVNRAEGTLRELVRLRRDFIVSGGTGSADRRLDYNHMLLHVRQAGAGGGSEVIVGEFQWSGRGAVQSIAPKRLDVRTGRVRSIAQGTPDYTRSWLFDAASEPRVALAGLGAQRRVHWRAPGQDDWVVLLEADALHMPWAPHSVDSVGQLYVTTSTGPGGTRELWRFDFSSGQPASAPLVTVAGFDFAGYLVSETSGGHVLGVRVDADAETTVWLDPRMNAVQEEVDRRLTGLINRISCRRCDSDERVLLIQSWSDRDPGQITIWRGAAQPLDRVGSTMKGIEPARMATLDLHRIRARDGLELPV